MRGGAIIDSCRGLWRIEESIRTIKGNLGGAPRALLHGDPHQGALPRLLHHAPGHAPHAGGRGEGDRHADPAASNANLISSVKSTSIRDTILSCGTPKQIDANRTKDISVEPAKERPMGRYSSKRASPSRAIRLLRPTCNPPPYKRRIPAGKQACQRVYLQRAEVLSPLAKAFGGRRPCGTAVCAEAAVPCREASPGLVYLNNRIRMIKSAAAAARARSSSVSEYLPLLIPPVIAN